MSIVQKNGHVRNLKSISREKGHGGQVSVAVFSIDEFPAEYNLGLLSWGASPEDPPFQDGERIVASGQLKNEKLIINSLYLPDQNKLIHQPIFPIFSIAFGLFIICLISAIALVGDIFRPDGHFFKYIAIFLTTLAFDSILIFIIVNLLKSRRSLQLYKY